MQYSEIISMEGVSIQIDAEDYDALARYKWIISKEGKRRYAVTFLAPRTRMHRIILKASPGQIIDHKNGNGLDNRKSNLRFCTHTQNMRNRAKSTTNKVGFKGVSWSKARGKFEAQITVDRKIKHLGFYECPFKAARAYDAAAIEFHGEFAKTNF